MWSSVNRLSALGRFFHHFPGFETPQCGHLASSALISLLQLGQMIDFLLLLDMDYLGLRQAEIFFLHHHSETERTTPADKADYLYEGEK
jgi:hypothetical protein